MRLISTVFIVSFLAFIPFFASANESQEEGDSVTSISCDNLRGLDRALCTVKKRIVENGEEIPSCSPGERNTQNQRAYCLIKGNQERKANVRSTDNRRSRKFAEQGLVRQARNKRVSTSQEADKVKRQRNKNIRQRLHNSSKNPEEVKKQTTERRVLHRKGRQDRRSKTTEVLRRSVKEREKEMKGRIESLQERRARRRAEVKEEMLMKRGDAKKNAISQRERRKVHLEERRQRVR
jgi:hypothetical protein